MSQAARRRLISLAAVAGVLAMSAGGVTVMAVARGSAHARSVSLADTGDSGAQAAWAPAVSPAASVVTLPAAPAPPAPSSTPAPVSASLSRALATAAARPPPVVDGIRRFNVASAHSPELAAALSAAAAPAAAALPSTTGVRGIDVASYEHPHGAAIDWAQVARAGYKFVFVKASEGNYYANPYYATDLAQAKAAGLYAAGYHFAVPNVSSGTSQADYAVKQARYAADGRTMPLALDIEYNPYGPTCYGLTAAAMVAWISAFTSEVRRLTGQLPVIYSTAGWWRSCTGNSTAFGSDPLWIAAWGASPGALPPGWRDWTFWQYTSHGQVPGIDGNVDISYFGRAVVRLLDPGAQATVAGTAVSLQVASLNAAAGQPPAFTAAGLPAGLRISSGGLITGTAAASAAGAHAVTVTASTPSGGTASVGFIWTVTSPAAPSPSPSPSPSPQPTSSSPASSASVPAPSGTPSSSGSASPDSSSPDSSSPDSSPSADSSSSPDSPPVTASATDSTSPPASSASPDGSASSPDGSASPDSPVPSPSPS